MKTEKQILGAGHLPAIDGLRAIAAIYVLLGHAWIQVWPFWRDVWPVGLVGYLTDWLPYAHFAVDAFIVVSGYCLMLPVVRRGGSLTGGPASFYWRRAKRILPTFWAAAILSYLLVLTCLGEKTGTYWDISIPVGPKALLANLLLVQDVVERGKLNHPFWSIAVEVHIYALFPAILFLWRKAGPLLAVAVLVPATSLVQRSLAESWLGGLTVHYIGLFTFGMLAAELAFNPAWEMARGRLPGLWGSVALWAVVAAACSAWPFPLVTRRFWLLDVLVGLSMIPVLLAASQSPSNLCRRALEWRPLSFTGGFSYSIYLIHAPLLQVASLLLMRAGLGMGDNRTLLGVFAACPIILCIAYVFSLVFERPFMSARPANRVAAVEAAPSHAAP